MRISRQQLALIIAKETMQLNDVRPIARSTAAYLLAEKRTAELESIIRDVMQYRADHGVVEATVVSAHEIGEQVLNDAKALTLQQFPTATNAIIRERHDPHVIGGVRLDYANYQLDLSVQAKLNTFKRITSQERTST